MYCDMHFLVVKINAFPCILNGACIAVPNDSIEIYKLDYCLHYNLNIYVGLQNGTNLFNSIKYC